MHPMMAGGDLYMVFICFYDVRMFDGDCNPKTGNSSLSQPVFLGMTTGEIRSNNLCTVMETTWKSLTQVSWFEHLLITLNGEISLDSGFPFFQETFKSSRLNQCWINELWSDVHRFSLFFPQVFFSFPQFFPFFPPLALFSSRSLVTTSWFPP